MKLFDVYPLFPIEPVRAEGSFVYDNAGTRYLDMYGGHAVISIGHSHPHYTRKLSEQLGRIGFYSNTVQIPIQLELANLLADLSGYPDYNLFLCNSGAEANENAFKLASFKTGRTKIVAIRGSFHGRTSAAVAATDDASIAAPMNFRDHVSFVEMNDNEALATAMTDEVCALIIEGIQGVGGVQIPSADFLQHARRLCDETGAFLILDEIQSGYGRSGKFFAHQHADVQADMITMAKGMGNGFPVAGVLISPKIEAKHGLLGTTFGGNYLACAASIAVLEVIRDEKLIDNALEMGEYLIKGLAGLPGVRDVRGQGLMIGLELENPCADVRKELLFSHKVFTGTSSDKRTLRLLPSLAITRAEADIFLEAVSQVLTPKTVPV